jgi:phosphate transport system substrate-binding protein
LGDWKGALSLQNRSRLFSCLSVAFILGLLLFSSGPGVAQIPVTLVATGSSLPEPLYVVWSYEYQKAHPEVQVRYLPEGTAESAARILAGNGDFGGGDAPIPDIQLRMATRQIVELPTVLIGIAVVYNLPGISGGVRLSGPVLASIFLGKTTSWRDPEIVKLNPDLRLPNLPIKVMHRTEGKGSSYIFSEFLSKVSVEFLAKVGRGVSPKWPVGDSFGRTPDLLEAVQKSPGAIGYTELNWAEKSTLPTAAVKNVAGAFLQPSAKSIAAAASALESKMTEEFRVSLTNAPGKESYPIASFTWFYVPAKAADPQRGRAVGDFLTWVYGDGQKVAQERGYAALPGSVLEKVRAKASTLR